MTSPKYPPVEVTWEDAFTATTGWQTVEEYLKSFDTQSDYRAMRTVGFMIRRDDQCVVLALSVDRAEACVADCIRIPAGMIREVRSLVSDGPS